MRRTLLQDRPQVDDLGTRLLLVLLMISCSVTTWAPEGPPEGKILKHSGFFKGLRTEDSETRTTPLKFPTFRLDQGPLY